MRIFLCTISIFWCLTQGTAQERIPNSFSVSAGQLLTKGFQLAGHYHVNLYDEFRLEYANNNKTFRTDSLNYMASLQLKRISLNYVKGLRLPYSALNKVSIYLGSGLILGKEQLRTTTFIDNQRNGTPNTIIQNNSFPKQTIGIRFFGELDIAVIKKSSLYLRFGNSWLFTEHLGKKGEMAIGIRVYF